MSWTQKATASIAATSGGTSGSIDTTGSNLIYIAVSYGDTSVISVSDSKNNIWTALGPYPGGATQSIAVYFCLSPTVGSGHTFTVTATSDAVFAGVVAWSAPGTPSYQTSSWTTAFASGESVTPISNDSLVVSVIGLWAAGYEGITPTISTFTVDVGVARSAGVNYGGFTASYNQATAAAITPAWSPASYGSATAGTGTLVFNRAPIGSVAFDAVGPNSASKTFAGLSSFSWTHTPVSGTPTAVAAGVAGAGNSTVPVVTGTYGGTNMGEGGAEINGLMFATLLGLAHPLTGAQTVSISLTHASTGAAGSVSVTRSSRTLCFSHVSAGANGTGTTATDAACTSAVGELVIDVCGCNNSTFIAGAGQATRWAATSGTKSATQSIITGNTSVTMSETLANSVSWAIISGSFKQAPASPAGSIIFMD